MKMNQLFRCYEEFGRTVKNGIGKKENFMWSDCRPSPWPNSVFNVQFNQADNSELINEIAKTVVSEELPIDMVCNANLINKETELCLEKYFDMMWEAPGMMLELINYQDKKYSSNELHILRPDTSKDILKWAEIVCEVIFGTSVESQKDTFYNMLSTLHDSKKIKLFSGEIENGKVVATSLLFIDDIIGGVYHVSVKSEMRNKGYGKEITNAAVSYAKKIGLKYCFLVASDMGVPVYKKLGFNEFERYIKYRLKNDYTKG